MVTPCHKVRCTNAATPCAHGTPCAMATVPPTKDTTAPRPRLFWAARYRDPLSGSAAPGPFSSTAILCAPCARPSPPASWITSRRTAAHLGSTGIKATGKGCASAATGSRRRGNCSSRGTEIMSGPPCRKRCGVVVGLAFGRCCSVARLSPRLSDRRCAPREAPAPTTAPRAAMRRQCGRAKGGSKTFRRTAETRPRPDFCQRELDFGGLWRNPVRPADAKQAGLTRWDGLGSADGLRRIGSRP